MKRNKTMLQIAIILAIILVGAGSVLAEPNKKGKKQKLTKQKIKKTLKRIEKHNPELANTLREIRRNDRALFRQNIRFMRNRWNNKKQASHGKHKKWMQHGKNANGFGDGKQRCNKPKSNKQCDMSTKKHGRGQRGMGMYKGRGRQGMRKDRNRGNGGCQTGTRKSKQFIDIQW